MPLLTYDYATPTDYTKVQTAISGGYGQLDLTTKTGLSFSEVFDSPTGFTYESTKAHINYSGINDNLTFVADYATSINADYGAGILTGTGTSGPTIIGGKLDLTGGAYVTYSAVSNADSIQSGCIRFKFTPNYSGTPSADKCLFDVYRTDGVDNNSIQLIHEISTGTIRFRACDSSGSYIYNGIVDVWSPISGTEYEFEVDYDFTGGSQRIFIGGVQLGSTISATGSRSNLINYLRIGATNAGTKPSSGKFDDVMIYSSVQHYASYTPITLIKKAYSKVQRETNCTFFANYNVNEYANYADGGTKATLYNSAAVTGGYLDLTGGGNRYASCQVSKNVDQNVNTGTIEFAFVPNYSGSPASEQTFFGISKGGSSFNLIKLFHTTAGKLNISMYNSAGSSITLTDLGAFAPISGTGYIASVNWNLTGILGTSAIRVFINGSQFGGTLQSALIRDSVIGIFIIGGDSSGASTFNGKFDWFKYYKSVQYTANYTPSAEPKAFAETDLTVPIFTDPGPGTIQTLGSITSTEEGSPRYRAKIGTNEYYWTGAVWDISDGSYVQSTSKTNWNTNIASFADITGEQDFELVVSFPETDTLASVDALTLSYTAQQYYASGTIVSIPYFNAEAINSFTSTEVLGGETIRYGLLADAVLYYHDGSDWVESDGTLAQLNTRAQVIANVATFISDIGANAQTQLHVYLETAHRDGATAVTPKIDIATFDYNYGGLQPTPPAMCVIWGYILDMTGIALEDATVEFTFYERDKEYSEAASHIIGGKKVSATTDANGYFDIALIRSTEFEGTVQCIVKITDADGNKVQYDSNGDELIITIPNLDTANLTTLLTAE